MTTHKDLVELVKEEIKRQGYGKFDGHKTHWEFMPDEVDVAAQAIVNLILEHIELPEEKLGGQFNLELQKILTDYGNGFSPPLNGNDLYHVASDIWDAHCKSITQITNIINGYRR